jgi:hypothetical protein
MLLSSLSRGHAPNHIRSVLNRLLAVDEHKVHNCTLTYKTVWSKVIRMKACFMSALSVHTYVPMKRSLLSGEPLADHFRLLGEL